MKEDHTYPLVSGLRNYGFIWNDSGHDPGKLVWINGSPVEVPRSEAVKIMRGDWNSVRSYFQKWHGEVILVEITQMSYEFNIASPPGSLTITEEVAE